jgi:cell wall-associated NlpC family hydrolase
MTSTTRRPRRPGFAGALIAAAEKEIGLPYVWGGGTYSGPSGIGRDGRGPTYPGASEPHHVAIYLGGDRNLGAPQTGENVRYGTLSEFPGQTATVRRVTEP